MAVAAPLSSASLKPTKITTRIARPVDHNCSRPTTAILPTVKTSRRRARSS